MNTSDGEGFVVASKLQMRLNERAFGVPLKEGVLDEHPQARWEQQWLRMVPRHWRALDGQP